VTTLIVTNDFPPLIGGIETFVRAAATALGDDVVVLTRHAPDGEAYDRTCPFPVVRHQTHLLPTPQTARLAAALLREHRCSGVLFGAAAPLGLLGPGLRRAGARRIAALSHGHEVWWATLPGSRAALRRIVGGVDVLGVVSHYTGRRIAAALPSRLRPRLRLIRPPVGEAFFAAGAARLADPAPGVWPVRVVAAARLVAQKGLADLLDAWAMVAPGADQPLTIVGDGPAADGLRHQAAQLPADAPVRFVGAVPHAKMPELLSGADLLVHPVRTRLAGLNPEGFGLICPEASATGCAVLVADAGGAAETIRPGLSGELVPSRDPLSLARALESLLADPGRVRALGAAGHDDARRFGLAPLGAELSAALACGVSDAPPAATPSP